MMKTVLTLFLFCSLPAWAGAPDFGAGRPEVRAFVERMQKEHDFDPQALAGVLAQAERRQGIIDAMSRPAEKTLTWPEYRARFITGQRIAQGVQFWSEHRELLEAIERDSGVPAKYVVAIVGVETSWGRITGRHRVLDALATLAFDYPPRSKYFTAELEQFLLLAREESIDPLDPLGSYAGAMGPPQFMPRSVRQYAVDRDGDGRRDLWSNWEDILGSVAHYLQVHGWKREETLTAQAPPAGALPDAKPTGSHNFGVIMRYNRSPLYAMAVHELAVAIANEVFADDGTPAGE
jgi:membrane-bound lytic murein transglycosylase B